MSKLNDTLDVTAVSGNYMPGNSRRFVLKSMRIIGETTVPRMGRIIISRRACGDHFRPHGNTGFIKNQHLHTRDLLLPRTSYLDTHDIKKSIRHGKSGLQSVEVMRKHRADLEMEIRRDRLI